MFQVQQRLARLRERLPAMRLYALVDGAQYQAVCKASFSDRSEAAVSLFSSTDDAQLADGGPWLLDTEAASASLVSDLAQLELRAPAVSWLISAVTLEGLVQLLQLRLDSVLPDGRKALLRFWDPRVLVNLVGLLTAAQREAFFEHIHEWHFLVGGQRAWVGRHDVELQ
jgi:hypothetical protein